MKTLLSDAWDKLRTSLWFIPTLMAAACGVLAFVMVRAQGLVDDEFLYQTRWLASGDAEGSRQILATIAGSIITVTGVIFSVTLVALSLASQQFGPRLLRNFMRDRGNQIVLGTFIGTFLYSMLVLRVVHEPTEESAVPYLAFTGAVVLVLIAVAVLIYFIHHVVTSIQAETVILNVSQELHRTMHELYPETDDDPEREESGNPLPEKYENGEGWPVRSNRSGYVRALDVPWLIELADRFDLVICIHARPGRFVVEGMSLAAIHSDATRHDLSHKEIDRHVRKAVFLGPARTAEQDIEFSIAQLVEIAVRSLSPSLNDPFTAMACLDRLGEAISQLGLRSLPKKEQCYSGDRLRLIVDRPSFDGMVDLAFNQIRQNSRDKVSVSIRILEVITVALDRLKQHSHRSAPLLNQARMVANAASREVPEQFDREEVARRYADILHQCTHAEPA